MDEINLNRSISDSCAMPSRSSGKVDSGGIEQSEDLRYDRTYVVNLSIGYSGAERSDEFSPKDCSSYSEEEWNELSKEKKEAWLNDYTRDWANEYIEYSWGKKDER